MTFFPAFTWSKTRTISSIFCAAALTAAIAVLAPPGASAQEKSNPEKPRAEKADSDKVSPRGAAIKEFQDRVKEYVALQKKLDGGLPALEPDNQPAKIDARQKLLGERIREARGAARPGDVFGDAAPLFKEIIARDAKTRGFRDAYAAMEEVPPQKPPAVNAAYPEKAALATVPPLILVNLPPLPDGIEYRFMGRDLILRDRQTNLIVDFLAGAVPAFK